MKKYFNWVDYTVFIAIILCLGWIYFYKFYWLNSTDLLFINADKWAEIFYTVVTSIIASGFFYIVTIFLYKLKQIKGMKKDLIFYLTNIDDLNDLIFSQIKVENTNTVYTVDTFMLKYKKDELKALNDFNTAFNNQDTHNKLSQIMSSQESFITSILINYSSLVDCFIIKELRDNIYILYSNLKYVPLNISLKELNGLHLLLLVHTVRIINMLRETYKISK